MSSNRTYVTGHKIVLALKKFIYNSWYLVLGTFRNVFVKWFHYLDNTLISWTKSVALNVQLIFSTVLVIEKCVNSGISMLNMEQIVVWSQIPLMFAIDSNNGRCMYCPCTPYRNISRIWHLRGFWLRFYNRHLYHSIFLF